MKRTTINNPVSFSGAGLFTGEPISLTISPAYDQSGIVFHHAGEVIPTTIESLSMVPVHRVFTKMKPRCTSVGASEVHIATVEHLLSALAGLGITDASIEIDSEHRCCEIPIFDGSAIEYVRAIQQSGTKELDSQIDPIIITQTIRIEENESSITIEPADSPSYYYTLDYPNQPIPSATVEWTGEATDYAQRIAHARTFCLKHEADAMQSAGLFSHLTISDLLVIGDAGPIENTYRDEHECALHKLLDLIGDLALVGRPLQAKITAIRSGHSLAHQAAKAIVEQVS